MTRASARKLALLASLYLSQGLPFGFFTQAVPMLLRQQGVSLAVIGATYLFASPWVLKFLWAPFVDRHTGSPLGARRGFILPLQAGTIAALVGVAFLPVDERGLALAAAFLVTQLLAATQDIATDALAVDLLDERERGLGNGVQVAGYRIGMILGGGVIPILYDRLGWTGSFLSMAAVLAVASVPIALTREAPRTSAGGGYRLSILVAELGEFLHRPGVFPWLLVVILVKTGEWFGNGMLKPFLVDLGYTLSDAGWMVGTLGFGASLAGALTGGALVPRLGRGRAIVLFALLQAATIGAWAFAALDVSTTALYVLCGLEHFCASLATAAIFTAMMDASRPERAATDYTIQSCLCVGAQLVGAAVSGVSAQRLGYAGHFALASAICFAGAAYAAWYAGSSGSWLLGSKEEEA